MQKYYIMRTKNNMLSGYIKHDGIMCCDSLYIIDFMM